MMKQIQMDPNQSKKLIVALSGGPDSMALLYLMKAWTKPSRLVAVTVDHGFREESAREANQVHEWVSSINVTHVTKKIDWKGLSGSKPSQTQLENQGREQRYRLLHEVCETYHTKEIVVAHHGDDQIETFLMRLYRGSGVSGLACMRSIQEMEDGTYRIRPLLQVSKQRLLETCKARSIPFVTDPSNTDLQYDRNRVRHGISLLREQNAMDVGSILHAIHFFQDMRDAMDTESANALRQCCQYNSRLGICRLNATALSQIPSFIVASVLRKVCFGISGVTAPSEKAVHRISQMLRTGHIPKPVQVGGCVSCRSRSLGPPCT